MLILLHMFLCQGKCGFPVLFGRQKKKETKTAWEKAPRFMGKVSTYKCTSYLGRVLWVLTDWIKGLLDYYRTQPRSWQNSKQFWIFLAERIVTVNSCKLLGGRKKMHVGQNKWISGRVFFHWMNYVPDNCCRRPHTFFLIIDVDFSERGFKIR